MGRAGILLPLNATSPELEARRQVRLGLIYGAAAYLWWGVVPLYFHLLRHVAPLGVLCHRVIWSLVFMGALISIQRRWGEVRAVAASPRNLGLLTVGSLLIAANWYVFIYAVSIGQTVQASLGYYINPLVNVVLGFLVLRERLRAMQWASVALATAAVVNLALHGTSFPWIALSLAISFGLYALLRKFVHVGPLIGLMVETAILLPPTIVLLAATPVGDTSNYDAQTYALLMLAGIVTALPLLWFANAARRLRLATLGFLQYLGPSVQLVMAVLVLGEQLSRERIIAFSLIWLALAIYTWDSVRAHRAAAVPVAETPE